MQGKHHLGGKNGYAPAPRGLAPSGEAGPQPRKQNRSISMEAARQVADHQ